MLKWLKFILMSLLIGMGMILITCMIIENWGMFYFYCSMLLFSVILLYFFFMSEDQENFFYIFMFLLCMLMVGFLYLYNVYSVDLVELLKHSTFWIYMNEKMEKVYMVTFVKLLNYLEYLYNFDFYVSSKSGKSMSMDGFRAHYMPMGSKSDFTYFVRAWHATYLSCFDVKSCMSRREERKLEYMFYVISYGYYMLFFVMFMYMLSGN